MKTTMVRATGFVITLCASPGFAGDSYSMNGRSNNESGNAMAPVGEDLVVVHVSNGGTLELEDTANPAHGATGNCSGSVLLGAGEPEGSGLCTYETSAGDVMVVRWVTESINEAGGNEGRWELVGGSGPWASANGSGSYSDTPGEDGTTSINTVTGDISFD